MLQRHWHIAVESTLKRQLTSYAEKLRQIQIDDTTATSPV
jgi:hypothetical protein